MSPNTIVWFEIYVQDTARAKAFYEAVLGTSLQRMDSPGLEMWAFPQPEGGAPGGALVKMPGLPSGGNSTIVYFGCTDCAVEAGRAAASGGKIFKEKFSIGPHGFVALVTDTEGNMIGLHSRQ
jgi:predicted enzyme related to lactoylglutathione lyase